jgi:hypothetical protein
MAKKERTMNLGRAVVFAVDEHEKQWGEYKIGDNIALVMNDDVVILHRDEDDPNAGMKVALTLYHPIRINAKLDLMGSEELPQ